MKVVLKRYENKYSSETETSLVGVVGTGDIALKLIKTDLDNMERNQLLVDRDSERSFISSDSRFEEVTYNKKTHLKMDEVNKLKFDYVVYFILSCKMNKLEDICIC